MNINYKDLLVGVTACALAWQFLGAGNGANREGSAQVRRPPDGATPDGSVTDVKDVLYGTTFQGGAYNLGTVFAITR
ncbi:MAG TPA: hypothetical protein VMF67_09520 [Rhizomicrobium sp.]|nr:hypothetical protein [Rhizomicrobium sp.]